MESWKENIIIKKENTLPLGIKFINNKNYEKILENEFKDFLSDNHVVDVLCCGMIGSKQGWKDAGYLKVPFIPSFHNQLVSIKTKNKKLLVTVINFYWIQYFVIFFFSKTIIL